MYTHLLIDLPSGHEVDDWLPTECDVIRAVVSNLGQGKNVKHVRATRLASLQRKRPRKPYEGVRFLHVAGHGNKRGAGLIGGRLTWERLAEELKEYCAPLASGEDRVLCLSCCHSKAAVTKMMRIVGAWFTGYYFFREKSVGFSDAITAWSLFYLQKDAMAPMGKLWTKNSKGQAKPVNAASLINLAVPDVRFTHIKQ